MRFIRLFAGSIIVLFLIATGISLLLPNRVRISRAVNISASPEVIWTRIDSMQHWQQWNPFFEGVNPSDVRTERNDSGFVNQMEINGTMVSWISRTPRERAVAMTRPGKPVVQNAWQCITHAGSDSTTLQWSMDIKVRWYPWEKLGSIMFERSYGPGMEKGLSNIRMQTASRSSKK